MIGLRWLQEALQVDDSELLVEELEFVCLQSIATLQGAIQCCRQSGIKRLSLKNYSARLLRQNRDLVSETIRSGLLVDPYQLDDDSATNASGAVVMLESLEIANYPIGAEGAQILAEAMSTNSALKTLKLIDCDLRSDSATYVAHIIRENQCLETLDLSYNRHYLGSQITRELTVKTLVQRGLKHNLSLLELHMEQTRGGDSIDRSKIDRQLDINRFRKNYLDSRRDPMEIHPFMWCHLLARVSAKPAALYVFLQDSMTTLFSR
jgi:hypothetical protein